MNPSLRVLGVLLLLGSACARRLETSEEEKPCCTDVQGCLALLGDSKGPVQDILSLPVERLEPSKRCAAQELAEQGPAAHAGLIALLSHADPQVRSGAALALSLADFIFPERPPDAVPALLDALQRGPPELPLAALVNFDDARAEPALRRYLQAGPTQSALRCVGRTLERVVMESLEAPDITEPVLARGARILCGVDPELTPRLQAVLRRELARPTLWRPSDPSCQVPVPRTCQLIVDGCMPYAGSLARALSLNARQEVYPEFLQALARDDERLTPLILSSLLESGARSPELDAWLAPLLESPAPDCRQYALRRLGTPPPQSREVIRSLLERGAPWEREAATSLLAHYGDASALEALLRALDDPHAGVQAAAALALGRMKEKASVALPRLDALASTHASPFVRFNAALARYWMTEQWKPPKAPPCPVSANREVDVDQWMLRLRTGTLRLRGFWPSSDAAHATASGPCADVSRRWKVFPLEGWPQFVPMDQACLILVHGFEGMFASTRVSEKGRTLHLDHWGRGASPQRVLELQGKRLLFHGASHMGLPSGGVSELTRTPQGGWMMTPFAPLPGYPVAHAMDSQGDLVVATQSGTLFMDSGSYSDVFDMSCTFPVVRITRDGQVFDVE